MQMKSAQLNGYSCEGNLFVTRYYQHVEEEVSGQSWEALVLKDIKGKIICKIPRSAIPQEGRYEGYIVDGDKKYYGKVKVIVVFWAALDNIAELEVVGLGAPELKDGMDHVGT